jgi:hypothetical protein
MLVILHETALTRGVGRQPAKGAMELSRLVQHRFEGVVVTLVPLTTARSPRVSLISSRSFRASGVLGECLLEVKPPIDVESRLARMSVSWLGTLSSWTVCGSQISMVLAMVARPLGARGDFHRSCLERGCSGCALPGLGWAMTLIAPETCSDSWQGGRGCFVGCGLLRPAWSPAQCCTSGTWSSRDAGCL